ncbi:MarR family winged helix-turn-helix transcriptional regulator [Actinoplanes solisilvae]|uniref:MarR family winged helix-turn-helix transcriptional regulator n=1 Tax=Actinoplanes solisilvae TaxID=2486853 RepID=UPI000FDC8B2B|nr:MarR family transcriptional regulator [Actinoplanes solisilvae]
MSDTGSDIGTAAWAGLLRVHAALVPRIDKELQSACGLPLTWYDVLLELNSAPARRLSMGELGEVAVVSRTRASRVVDQLVEAGLVARELNPEDKRSAWAVITEEGRKRLRSAAPIYLDAIRRHFTAQMTDDDARIVATALEKVLTRPAGWDINTFPRPR